MNEADVGQWRRPCLTAIRSWFESVQVQTVIRSRPGLDGNRTPQSDELQHLSRCQRAFLEMAVLRRDCQMQYQHSQMPVPLYLSVGCLCPSRLRSHHMYNRIRRGTVTLFRLNFITIYVGLPRARLCFKVLVGIACTCRMAAALSTACRSGRGGQGRGGGEGVCGGQRDGRSGIGRVGRKGEGTTT